MSRLFTMPRTVAIVGGEVSPGAKASFFLTGTSTPTNTYTDAALTTPHTNPVIADAAGVFAAIYIDPDIVYKLTLDDTNDALIYTEDPIQDQLTQANIGLIFYPRSADEISAGVTPTNFFENYGDVRRNGAVGDGVTDDSSAIADAIDVAEISGGSVFGHAEDTYSFGTLAGNAVKITVTADIHMDWRGAKLLIAGTDGAFTGDALFRFEDCVADIRNYTFEDSTFAVATSTSRGVQPVNIRNVAANTKGHRIGPCHIISGQSMLTASTADLTKRASDIELVGPCTADESYYGINLANNGDRVRGSYFVNEFERLIFIYGVDDVEMTIHGGTTSNASSADLFIFNDQGSSGPATTNIKIKAIFEQINGLVRIAADIANGGDATFKNIDLDIHVKSYGANLPSTSNPIIAIGTQSGAGWNAASTVTMDNIRIDFKSDGTLPTNPIAIQTTSPNYGELEMPSIGPIAYSQIAGFLFKTGSSFRKGISGETLSVVITAITQANPAVVSATAHGYANGAVIGIIGGDMTEVNDRVFTVANQTANTFELSGEDSTGHTAYTTGGTAHATVAVDLDDIIDNIAAANWAFAVDSIGRFDTSFAGQKTAIEHWSIQGYVDSSEDLAITAQTKAYLSQSGGDSPLGQFIAPDSGSVLYGIMGGYDTLVGALTLNYRHLG